MIQQLPLSQQKLFLQSLNPTEQAFLSRNPLFKLTPKQLSFDGDWRYYWFRGGRGTGKSETAIAWAIDRLLTGDVEIAYVGPTHTDLKKEIVPRLLSALYETFGEDNISHNLSDMIITVQGHKLIKLYSAEREIRGCNANAAVCEEMCIWADQDNEKIEKRFQILDNAVRRKGNNLCQIFIASTPKPLPFFIRFDNHCRNHISLYKQTILTIEDAIFLDSASKQAFLSGTSKRLQRQELYADLLTDVPEALWDQHLIDQAQLPVPHFNLLLKNQLLKLNRTIIAVDPAVTTNQNSDETGLFAASLGSDNKVYLLEDASGKMSPNIWAQKAVSMYHKTSASLIIMESNQGGNLLEQAIKAVDPTVRVKLIHASVGKQTRFEPIVAAYERNEVIHVGKMDELENEMLTYNPYNPTFSPDRVDAMAYAVYELLINKAQVPARSIRNLGRW